MSDKAAFSLDFAGFIGAANWITPILNAAALPELEATGEAIVEVAKRHASSLKHDDRDLIPLADTIGVQGTGVDKHGPYVDVGTRSKHALFQEFGTVNDPAHPFMRPAIAEITSSNTHGVGLNLAPRRFSKAHPGKASALKGGIKK